MAKPNTRARSESAQRFRALVYEAVTPDDVLAICRMLARAARQGNVIAAKLLFNYLGGTPGVRILLPALEESEPDAEPGSSVPANETATDASENP